MGLTFLIVIGAILGWLASIILRAESRPGLTRNIGAGIGGALLAGLLVAPLTGHDSMLSDTYRIGALLLSLSGALVAIAGVNLFRTHELR